MKVFHIHVLLALCALWLAFGVGSQASAARQDGQQVSISGTAEMPDGSPAGGLEVVVKALQKRPQPDEGAVEQEKGQGEGMFRTLAQGTTDADGKFSLSVAQSAPELAVTLEIGQSRKTHWAKRQLELKGKDVDLGKIRLREPVRN